MRFAYDNVAACSAPRLPVQARIAALPARAVAALRAWLTRRRTRGAILQLDDHLLRDIGLDRFQAERMVARPVRRE